MVVVVGALRVLPEIAGHLLTALVRQPRQTD